MVRDGAGGAGHRLRTLPWPSKAREEAAKFLKTLAGLIRLLERADTTDAFNQLRAIHTTTLGNLIAFMEIYNLRFGAATTPRQRAVYRDLFAKIDPVRDQVVKQLEADDNPSLLSNLNPVFGFFWTAIPVLSESRVNKARKSLDLAHELVIPASRFLIAEASRSGASNGV
jgi:hypothetical protein